MSERASALLDPWADAALIARRLHEPGALLLVAIGAEAWCSKCRRLRPLFEALVRQHAHEHVATVWLDLENHAEFMGRFVPEDLPLLLLWRAGRCESAALLLDVWEPGLRALLRDTVAPADAPALWTTFGGPGAAA